MKPRKRPASVEAAMKQLKQDAHERVLARGLVQFRLDRENMQQLLELADEKGLGYGVLARVWICERLDQERRGGLVSQSAFRRDDIRKMIKEEVQEALKAPHRRRKRAG